jgi:hypothetical protein
LKKALVERGVNIGTDNPAINEKKFACATTLYDAYTASS